MTSLSPKGPPSKYHHTGGAGSQVSPSQLLSDPPSHLLSVHSPRTPKLSSLAHPQLPSSKRTASSFPTNSPAFVTFRLLVLLVTVVPVAPAPSDSSASAVPNATPHVCPARPGPGVPAPGPCVRPGPGQRGKPAQISDSLSAGICPVRSNGARGRGLCHRGAGTGRGRAGTSGHICASRTPRPETRVLNAVGNKGPRSLEVAWGRASLGS